MILLLKINRAYSYTFFASPLSFLHKVGKESYEESQGKLSIFCHFFFILSALIYQTIKNQDPEGSIWKRNKRYLALVFV